jgi:hypothetical protein
MSLIDFLLGTTPALRSSQNENGKEGGEKNENEYITRGPADALIHAVLGHAAGDEEELNSDEENTMLPAETPA